MTKLKQSLPPKAQARLQDWFDTAACVVMKLGKQPLIDSGGEPNRMGFWEYEDDRVIIKKWGVYDVLSVARKIDKITYSCRLLVSISTGRVVCWAPEEDILEYLKGLVVLELLAKLPEVD